MNQVDIFRHFRIINSVAQFQREIITKNIVSEILIIPKNILIKTLQSKTRMTVNICINEIYLDIFNIAYPTNVDKCG